MYKLTKPEIEGLPSNYIVRVADNAYIPMDEANTDYQEYLKWLSEGNTPLPAEEEAAVE